MKCHDCDRPADVEIESGDVIVGMCEEHLREHVEEIAGTSARETLDELLDAEGS